MNQDEMIEMEIKTEFDKALKSGELKFVGKKKKFKKKTNRRKFWRQGVTAYDK